MLPRVLLLTNDFPPRNGGIEVYCHNIVRRMPGERVAVFAPRIAGSREFDVTADFPIIRYPGGKLHPADTTKAGCLPYGDVLGRVSEVIGEFRPDIVCFGASVPLGVLAADLDVPCMGFTHGLEVIVSHTPLIERVREIAGNVRMLTAVSRWSQREVSRVADGACPVELLPAGVSTETFRPDAGGAAVRRRLGLGDSPVCVCVGRLVPRKGQDRLIEAWPQVVARVPDALLLLVGDGWHGDEIRALAAASPVSRQIRFAGEVSAAELPAYYAAGDVFAMPCRTRLEGMDLEALGIVFLEAAASGLPVVAGDSGGSAETVLEGETGFVVDGNDAGQVGEAVTELLGDLARAEKMGAAGRQWVTDNYSWDISRRRFEELLAAALG